MEDERDRGPLRALFVRAVGAMLERVLPRIEKWAHGRLPWRARRCKDTGDVVLEAVAGALVHLRDDQLRDGRCFERYVKASVSHLIVDEIRRANRTERVHAEAAAAPRQRSPDPLEQVIVAERCRKVQQALDVLSSDDRRLLWGRHCDEKSYFELADETRRRSASSARAATGRAGERFLRSYGRVGDGEAK